MINADLVKRLAVIFFAGLIVIHSHSLATELTGVNNSDVIVFDNVLVIGGVGEYGRAPIHVDAVEALLVNGNWKAPHVGDSVILPDGTEKVWERVVADDKGWINGEALNGGYVYFEARVPEARVMILDAVGHSRVYVNGELRAGDPYHNNFVKLPVSLQAGGNEFLFVCGRGSMRASLTEPAGDIMFMAGDTTLPHLLYDMPEPVCGGIVISNNTDGVLEDLYIVASGSGLPTRETAVPVIGPMTVRKVPFWAGGLLPANVKNRCTVKLQLVQREGSDSRVLDTTEVTFGVTDKGSRHNRTFISDIDGSVQYYAVTPAKPVNGDNHNPGIVFTLHGAGVQASGQAAVYAPKSWAHVVAPTNRRHFGFDWEDWGRLDFLEVYKQAIKLYQPDMSRIYLTGHSMGGHGTWHIGVTYPDYFAAIGPSAGWISFWSYAGAAVYDNPDPIDNILKRATASSDTLALSRNFLHYGVYILHGEKDDNVPAEQARTMKKHLSTYHSDFEYFEQPGAGHWWGNQCCDWPALFEFFNLRYRAVDDKEVNHVEFWTANPGVSSKSYWAEIIQQHKPLAFSNVVLDYDQENRKFTGTTENVEVLALSVGNLIAESEQSLINVELDGQELVGLDWQGGVADRLWLVRNYEDEDDSETGVWAVMTAAPGADMKGPVRNGLFKDVFRHNMMLVYGTAGSVEENKWAYARARYDAETFWYRGNGSIDVISDAQFNNSGNYYKEVNRSVILYGHAEMNSAWEPLLAGDEKDNNSRSPVQVRRGVVTVDDIALGGDNLACIFIRPRAGSDIASVGVVAGTGMAGLRLTDRLPYFVSGIAYPDCMILDINVLSKGVAGIRVAGFFGNDWSVANGDFGWGD